MKNKQLMNNLIPDRKVRGVVHEYWIERRRARMQGRKAASSGEGGPAGAQGLSRKKRK